MASTSLDMESEAYETDLESLNGTSLQNSSVTQFPESSNTEFEDDGYEDTLLALVDSQFPSEPGSGDKTGKDVQEWLDNADDGTLDISNPQSPTSLDNIHSEKIEKMGVALLDGIKNENNFERDAWLQVDDQEVPSGDPVSTFIEDVEKRLPLALMYLIKNCFSTPVTGSRCLYTAVLYHAAESVGGPNSCPVQSDFLKNIDIKALTRLRTLNGGYFSELRLSFRRCPKQKLPIVRAVERFVNNAINFAYEAENAILFTRFSQIPTIVHDCNEELRLGYTPDQLAKYGIRLQKAVHVEIVSRCLEFLALSGFKLKQVYLDQPGSYLSSNDSALSQQFHSTDYAESYLSSQGSTSTQNDFSSQNIDENENPADDNHVPALDALQNSPEFLGALQEFMRGNVERDSPGGSWNSQGSISPPQYSIPMREQTVAANDVDQDDGWLLLNAGELEHVNLNLSVSYNLDNRDTDSSDDEGPQRRRPRLELLDEYYIM